MHHEPLWHDAVNAALLLAGIFGLLLAVHWHAARRWWVKFGEALEDISDMNRETL